MRARRRSAATRWASLQATHTERVATTKSHGVSWLLQTRTPGSRPVTHPTSPQIPLEIPGLFAAIELVSKMSQRTSRSASRPGSSIAPFPARILPLKNCARLPRPCDGHFPVTTRNPSQLHRPYHSFNRTGAGRSSWTFGAPLGAGMETISPSSTSE